MAYNIKSQCYYKKLLKLLIISFCNLICCHCRDLSNGYLVAEIFSWYYPQSIQMHNFYTNGTSLKTKQLNWDLLNTVSILKVLSKYRNQSIHAWSTCKRILKPETLLNVHCWYFFWIVCNYLLQFIKKNSIDIPLEFTDAAMHCKEGAAQLLIERMYEILTNRQ